MDDFNNSDVGCWLYTADLSGRKPSEFIGQYHIHILVKRGVMTFSDGRRQFVSDKDHLAIWQMSNSIQHVSYSDDFCADVLLVSPSFLQRFNPEMVWASKGFIFIRMNPTVHLDASGLELVLADFDLFRTRLERHDPIFGVETLGRILQIFLFDLWSIFRNSLSQLETHDTSARLFLRFLLLVQQQVCQHREVAYYADILCITPKYLSQVCRSVSGQSALQWIRFYTASELVSLLNDSSKTLAEVADIMQFETPSHFSRFVKSLLGKSPSDFRKK